MRDGRRRNMEPADELELVRAEMKRLRAREAELKAELLGDGDGDAGSEGGPGAAAGRAGRHWRVEVVEQRRRTLDRKALPPEILSDPRYWKETVTRVVTTVPVGARPAAPAGEDGG